MLEVREDIVVVMPVERKELIVLVGAGDEQKKYHDLKVVMVGAGVTRTKPDDIVHIGGRVQPDVIRCDPFDSGNPTPHLFLTESQILGVER